MSVGTQAVEGAVVTGSIYGLVGMGFALLFRASKVLSFAQGGFVLIGASLFYDFAQHGWGFIPAVIATVAAVALLSAVLYVVAFARVAAREPFTTSVATIGLAGVVTSAVAIAYGTAPLNVPDTVVPTRAFHVLGVVIRSADIIVVSLAVVVAAALLAMLRLTPLGLRMRAVADNVSLAAHLGVRPARVAATAWTLAGAIAALAGVAFSVLFTVDPTGISNVGFLAFPAIILGGLDSVGGALVGGILVAGIQNWAQLTLGSRWVDLVSFAVMLAILLVRPTGIFGKAEVVRL